MYKFARLITAESVAHVLRGETDVSLTLSLLQHPVLLNFRLSLPPLLSVNTTPEAREEVSRCCTRTNCCPSTKLPCKGEAEFVRPVRLRSTELLLSQGMITSTGSPSPSPLAVHVSQCGRLIAGLSRLAFLSLTRSFASSLHSGELSLPPHILTGCCTSFFFERDVGQLSDIWGGTAERPSPRCGREKLAPTPREGNNAQYRREKMKTKTLGSFIGQ